MFRPHERVIHVSTGNVYRIVDVPTRLRISETNEPAYSYTLDHGPEITLWVSPQSRMEDGRFKAAWQPQ